ncbi:MAG: C39 family peptidase [Firmicutes bacterium]|nr:C39 family peptidase [Bacillota bacterium]
MKWKKWITALVMLGLLAAAIPSVSADPSTAAVTGNLLRITTAEDFSAAQLNNLTVDSGVGDGAVKLTDGAAEGTLVTGVYSCAQFTRMVASWNADTPDGTTVEVTARGHITGTDIWTDWLSWGVWGTTIARSCGDSETARDSYAYVDTDVFTLRDKSQTIDQFQLQVTLRSESAGATPVLRQLCATIQNNLDGMEIVPVYEEERVALPDRVVLETPAYSQLVRDPEIRSSICNPTTVTALLNDRGEDLLPEETALLTYDFNYRGFGNWAFALAAAGSFGYDCYVQFGSLDIIRQELAKGYSVGIDVHYMPADGGSLPYVENAPLASSGHLITVRGYETIDGVEYFYVSDSAADNDAEALRRYRADQLDAAWNNRIVYLIHEKEENAGTAAPQSIRAELRPAEDAENTYQLTADGRAIDLTANFLKNKILAAGGGTILARLAGEAPAEQAAPAKTTTANCSYLYDFRVDSKGRIIIDPKVLFRDDAPGTEHDLIVTVILNTGIRYEAGLTITNPLPVSSSSSAAEPASSAAESTAAPQSQGSFPWLWVGIGAALVAAVIVYVVLLRRKK